MIRCRSFGDAARLARITFSATTEFATARRRAL
jgi:hypothetical protein